MIETPLGWLMLYHGVRQTASGALYRLGLALFDLAHPDQCLLRGDEWIFGPEASYECAAGADSRALPHPPDPLPLQRGVSRLVPPENPPYVSP